MSERPALSTADLFLVAKALRHERSGRVYAAHRKGHLVRGGVLEQLQRLEDIFESLAQASADAERRAREQSGPRNA